MKKRILIVEDEEKLRRVLELQLMSAGFDVDHAAGVVGPGNFKPKTAWEIHPITKLEFLNN